MGLDWSGRATLATIAGGAYPALYRIFDAKTKRLLYIGETQNFGQRMKIHAQMRISRHRDR
jgi:predicted GIY-YIG superfamily endonuclease